MDNKYPSVACLHIMAIQLTKFKANGLNAALQEIYRSHISDLKELKEKISSLNYNKDIFPEEKYWNDARAQIEIGFEYNINSISIFDKNYPSHLSRIDSPPLILYTRGNSEILNQLPGMAVVGSRKCSENGAKIAFRIASFLSNNNWPVVSGLALGIDAKAHEGVIASQNPHNNIAVLAGGLDKPSPPRNSKLGYDILENGGLWVSEHPAGTPPKRHHFVPRNRIQIGLSAGSIIVESTIDSGSITQGKFCMKQNRPLFTVMPLDNNNKLGLVCDGNEYMVRNMGAKIIRSKNDYSRLLETINYQKSIMTAL